MKRNATAVWNGNGKEGTGYLTTPNGVLQKTQYSYKSRFEEGIGTNPEELIAAAHAGCFTMKLSFVLNAAGFTADSIEATATVELVAGVITSSHLVVTASVPGITAEQFAACAEEAKLNCPVSKALNMNISMEAQLK